MKRLPIAALVFVITAISGALAKDFDIDILDGTVNGKKIESFTMDSITDTYGRPSVSGSYETSSWAVYADDGVEFRFAPDCNRVCIYLVNYRAGADSSMATFSQYKRKLNKGLDGSWKLKKFLESFLDLQSLKQNTEMGYAVFKGSKTCIMLELDSAGFISVVRVASYGKACLMCNPSP